MWKLEHILLGVRGGDLFGGAGCSLLESCQLFSFPLEPRWLTRYLSSFTVGPESFISQSLTPKAPAHAVSLPGSSHWFPLLPFISRVDANDLEFLCCSGVAFGGQYMISHTMNSQ